jgi:hypothetical protein
MPLRDFDRLLAGAAAGDQNVDVRLAEAARGRPRKPAAQELVDGPLLDRRLALHPAREWILLVLLPDRQRHGILDGRQRRDRSAQSEFLRGLAHLLLQEPAYAFGPGAVEQPAGLGQRMERPIARRCRQPQRGNVSAGRECIRD